MTILTREEILSYLEAINEELRLHGQAGEIGLVGGAVMCLVFNARASTRDVDAVFEPSQVIRQAAAKVARQNQLSKDWLNDAAKGFLTSGFTRQTVKQFSNLNIWAPDARYMLAMKCISARWDSSDRDDVIFLIKYLKYTKPEQVLILLQEYYPKLKIPAKTQFFIEEILESSND